MATADPHICPALNPIAPTSIQPGGGFCMRLELAWGRLRRWYLRHLRPGYVRKMVERRQGRCDKCPHSIIDARDLKFYRNVCGYWFRDEDNPFRWRSRLRLAWAGLAEVVCFSVLFAMAASLFTAAALFFSWVYWIGLAITLGLWLFVISFFRDPARIVPADRSALLSPADGTITHIEEVEEPEFPGGRAFRISIFLSVFNVHVNRMPRGGRVRKVRYFPGAFLDARHAECAVRNEQLWIDLEEVPSQRILRVKQISGAIARRIVCWLKPGDVVEPGERFGMIKFGSRTDVLLPIQPLGPPYEPKVKVGDRVKGGSTILLRLQEP